MASKLDEARKIINEVDSQMAELFVKRMRAAEMVYEYKKEFGLPILDQKREAAVIEMIMNALPEIAKNVAEPLGKVDKITMYGDGNTTKLMKDTMGTVNQVSDGLMESMGLDLKSLLAGVVGSKLLSENKE